MSILYDERVDGVLPDVNKDEVLAAIRARIPTMQVLHQEEALRPFECDGLSPT